MRVGVLAASLVLAGCGATDPNSRRGTATETRAAGVGFAQQCAREARRAAVVVLCPTRLPLGGFESPRNYGKAPCTYLINLEPRGMPAREGAIYHVLFGGACRRWDLRTRGDGWPATLTPEHDGADLRLMGTATLVPGQSETAARRVRLHVLQRAVVGSAPALVLRNPPYPVGGIHGGHISVVWSAGDAGYMVSGHAVASSEHPNAAAGPRALALAIETLLAVARSMRRSGP